MKDFENESINELKQRILELENEKKALISHAHQLFEAPHEIPQQLIETIALQFKAQKVGVLLPDGGQIDQFIVTHLDSKTKPLNELPLVINSEESSEMMDFLKKSYEAESAFVIEYSPSIKWGELGNLGSALAMRISLNADIDSLILIMWDSETLPITQNELEEFEVLLELSCEAYQQSQLIEALGELEEQYEGIVNTMPSALIGVDFLGNVTLWSNKAELYFGISEIEILGSELSRSVPVLNKISQKIMEVFASKKETVFTPFRIVDSNGEPRYLQPHLYSMASLDRGEIGIRIDDVTEQQNLQSKVISNAKSDMFNQLLKGMAQNFKKTVSHISGAVELLNKDQSNLRENQKLEIKTIADLTEQADKMVHEMQEMSMVKSKETEVLNMVDVVSKMITIAKNSLDSRIEVLMDCIYESVHIKANCEKIETTILNLLINASEAIEGRGIISVHFESFKKDDNDFLKIKVIDNGKGMIQEELNRAFEPMYTSKEKNSGLGLNFVEQTINELSGEIYLESHEGKGTTVELILPVLELKETKINKKNSSNFSVVLVEEDDALRHLIERILTNMEVSFTSVTNGVEATRHIHKSPDPTLVVLDLDMKGLSGFDTYNLIKQLNPSQKFLLTSMDPHQEELQKIKQKGKVHLLGKPFSVETFELEVDFLFSYS